MGDQVEQLKTLLKTGINSAVTFPSVEFTDASDTKVTCSPSNGQFTTPHPASYHFVVCAYGVRLHVYRYWCVCSLLSCHLLQLNAKPSFCKGIFGWFCLFFNLILQKKGHVDILTPYRVCLTLVSECHLILSCLNKQTTPLCCEELCLCSSTPGTSPVCRPNTCVPVCRPSWATCSPTSTLILPTPQPPPLPLRPPLTASPLRTLGWVHRLLWLPSSGITEVWGANLVQDLAKYCSPLALRLWHYLFVYLPSKLFV